MKKNIIIAVYVMLLTVGAGCGVTKGTLNNQSHTRQKTAESQQFPDGQPLSSVPKQPVALSTGTAPLAITQIAKPLSKSGDIPWGKEYGAPFRVSVGQMFVVGEGCSYNPSYERRVTLQSITVKDGRWTIHFNELSPINKFIYVADTHGGYKKTAVNEKPTTRTYTLSQDEPIDLFNKRTGALFGTNGAYVPLFVSEHEVYFKYISLGC